MPAQWTADVIGQMHLAGITSQELANQLCCSPNYVSMVLNGHRVPKNAETRFRKALNELIQFKNTK